MNSHYKLILTLGLWISSSSVCEAALDQLTSLECQDLGQQLSINLSRQQRDARGALRAALLTAEHSLRQQLSHACQHPRAESSHVVGTPSTTRRQRRQAKRLQLELRGPYQGPKQQAWLRYYQDPYYCFGVRQTAVIVACTLLRQQAQQQFEQNWQTPNLSDQNQPDKLE